MLYQQEQELDRLFQIALDQEKVINEQKKSIHTQQLYIHLLEAQYKESSPIYKQPL